MRVLTLLWTPKSAVRQEEENIQERGQNRPHSLTRVCLLAEASPVRPAGSGMANIP